MCGVVVLRRFFEREGGGYGRNQTRPCVDPPLVRCGVRLPLWGLMATGCANSPSEGLSEVGEETVAPEQKTAYTFHQFMCGGGCSLKCTVRDGRLCLIEPNDALGEELGTVCLRGLSEVQHVYSADRIQTPLKRVGARGSNEFEAITWDEALDIIEEKIKGIQAGLRQGSHHVEGVWRGGFPVSQSCQCARMPRAWFLGKRRWRGQQL